MASQIIFFFFFFLSLSEIEQITKGYTEYSNRVTSPIYRIRLSPILICYSQLSSVQSRWTNKPRYELSWNEQGRNPANNMAASYFKR